MRFDPTADVAIVIPVYNRRAKTIRCLESLRAAPGDAVAVIVVDDGSVDGTSEYLANQSDVTVLRGSGDLWWTASVDLGCRHAASGGAGVIILLNDDNVVAANLVEALVEAVTTTSGCVSSVVLEVENGVESIFQAGGTLNWNRRGIGLRDTGVEYAADDRVEMCDWLPGCALAFPTSVFQSIEGFDHRRFPQYRGDIDFTLRARLHGYPCNVSYRTWVLNDRSDSPLTFRTRVTLGEFIRGFGARRSNYNIRETVLFAWRHCPRRLLLFYLAQFYLRYMWASLKTQRWVFSARIRASRIAT
jgi:GT2 family glycosyltransferase